MWDEYAKINNGSKNKLETTYNLYERLDKKSSLFSFLYRKRGGVEERVPFSRFV